MDQLLDFFQKVTVRSLIVIRLRTQTVDFEFHAGHLSFVSYIYISFFLFIEASMTGVRSKVCPQCHLSNDDIKVAVGFAWDGTWQIRFCSLRLCRSSGQPTSLLSRAKLGYRLFRIHWKL